MSTTTIRVSTQTRDRLRELVQVVDLPMQKIVDEAIKQYQRQYLLDATNQAYAKLRSDPAAWQAYCDEQAQWEQTLDDGLAGLA